jgi:hypothetical protein
VEGCGLAIAPEVTATRTNERAHAIFRNADSGIALRRAYLVGDRIGLSICIGAPELDVATADFSTIDDVEKMQKHVLCEDDRQETHIQWESIRSVTHDSNLRMKFHFRSPNRYCRICSRS